MEVEVEEEDEGKRKRLARKKERDRLSLSTHLLDLRQVLLHGRKHLAHGPLHKDVADLKEKGRLW